MLTVRPVDFKDRQVADSRSQKSQPTCMSDIMVLSRRISQEDSDPSGSESIGLMICSTKRRVRAAAPGSGQTRHAFTSPEPLGPVKFAAQTVLVSSGALALVEALLVLVSASCSLRAKIGFNG